MPANSEEQIFNFEGNLEEAFQAWLDSKDILAFSSVNPKVLPDQFIALMVEIGAATDKLYPKSVGRNEESQYAFTLNVIIQSGSSEEEESTDPDIRRKHQETVATCRKWLSVSNAKGNFDSFLPLYVVNFLTPAGSPRLVDDENDYYETTLTYSGQFYIRSDAWPS